MSYLRLGASIPPQVGAAHSDLADHDDYVAKRISNYADLPAR
ncbi:MAG: hypothetical protein ACIALR_14460 [Blastopirellula sp. JB062]